MKKLLATAALVAGLTGALAATAPTASAQLICVDLFVKIGGEVLLDQDDICV